MCVLREMTWSAMMAEGLWLGRWWDIEGSFICFTVISMLTNSLVSSLLLYLKSSAPSAWCSVCYLFVRGEFKENPVTKIFGLGIRCRGMEEQVDKPRTITPCEMMITCFLPSTVLLSFSWILGLSHSETFEVLWRRQLLISSPLFLVPFWVFRNKVLFPEGKMNLLYGPHGHDWGRPVKWGPRHVKTNDTKTCHVL